MGRHDLGWCHQCGNLLVVRGYFVAEGHQHEEYYCRACGGIERQAIWLRLDDPAWRKVYEQRQKLIAQGPTSERFLKRHRSDAQATRRWVEEIFWLGQRLVGVDRPEKRAARQSLGRRAPARERR
jgi:hypothetical protein